MDKKTLATYIDHTLLKPEATPKDIEQLCKEAVEYSFASVCINPMFVAQAGRTLKGSPVKVCTVIGFPLGSTTTAAKVGESLDVIDKGAHELDMVLPIGMLKEGMLTQVSYDISQVCNVAHSNGTLIKVILEISALTDEEIINAVTICNDLGVDFVKTSTGFGSGGAVIEKVKLMKSICKPEVKVKASGGIRDYATALAMIEAGASRLGVSASLAIMNGLPAAESSY
ncbi:MAG: deoxyribose-phosphate aldolase [Brevinema sp.]